MHVFGFITFALEPQESCGASPMVTPSRRLFPWVLVPMYIVFVVAVPVFAGRNEGAELGRNQIRRFAVFTRALGEVAPVHIEFPQFSCS